MGMQLLQRVKTITSLLVSAAANSDGSAFAVAGYDNLEVRIGTKAVAGGITALNVKVEVASDSGFTTDVALLSGAVLDLVALGANGEGIIAVNLNQSVQVGYCRVILENYAGTGTFVVVGQAHLSNRHKDMADTEHGTVVKVGF